MLESLKRNKDHGSEFTAEFAKCMVEGMPAAPYGPDIQSMAGVEDSMRKRFILPRSPVS